MSEAKSGYRLKHAYGRVIGLYADVQIKRECSCPVPVVYLDEDGDRVCFTCGQLVKTAAPA